MIDVESEEMSRLFNAALGLGGSTIPEQVYAEQRREEAQATERARREYLALLDAQCRAEDSTYAAFQ